MLDKGIGYFGDHLSPTDMPKDGRVAGLPNGMDGIQVEGKRGCWHIQGVLSKGEVDAHTDAHDYDKWGIRLVKKRLTFVGIETAKRDV